MSATLTNGRARKSLAEQIDRLDATLDGLADGLQEAVSAAVQEAVRRVLAEVLGNADVQARLQATPKKPEPNPMPVPDNKPSRLHCLGRRLCQWLSGCLARTGQAVRGAARWVAVSARTCLSKVAEGCRRSWNGLTTTWANVRRNVCDWVRTAWQTLWILRFAAVPLLFSVGVGVGLAVATYHGGPWLAATTSGLAGFVAALAVQVGLWLRRVFVGRAGETV